MQCEDIIQNTFMKFFENMEKIRNSERIDVWLFKTVRNQIFTLYRTKSIHVDKFNVDDVEEVDVDSGFSLNEEYEHMEMKELIMNELNKMSVGQREVFLLKEYGEFSYKEISAMMEISEELVKSRLHKTRQKLVNKISRVMI